MNFCTPSYFNNSYNNLLYFQKDLRLPIESYAIKDSEVTFDQVKQMASQFIAKKQNLLCKAEEAIQLGTLIGWAERFATKSLDAFIDCVRSHDFTNSSRLEEQLCIHLELLSDIQLSFCRHPFAISFEKNATLSTNLLYREKSILEAIIFSEKWRMNYSVYKYFFSLTEYLELLEINQKSTNNDLANIYNLLNTTLIKMIKPPDQGQLCFAHFLPGYFESPQIMNDVFSEFSFAPEDYFKKLIQNYGNQNKSVQSEFTFFQLLEKYNVKEISSSTVKADLMQELIERKIGRTQTDDFQECMYFGLALFFKFKNMDQGVTLKGYETMNQLKLFQQSAYFITQEGFNQRKEEFNTIILPNLLKNENFIELQKINQSEELLTRITSLYTIIEDQIRKDKNQETNIFLIVRQVSAIYDQEQQKEEMDLSDKPSSNSGVVNTHRKKPIELAERLLEKIFTPIENKCKVENDWTDILLLLPFIKYTRVKHISKRIYEVILHIFELEHPFSQDNQQGVENNLILQKIAFLLFPLDEEQLKQILEIKGIQSSIEFLDYLFVNSIKKNSPFGFSFLLTMLRLITNNEIDLTTKSTLKILEIIQKIIINGNLNISYCIYQILSKIVQSNPEKLKEASFLQIQSSFYCGSLYSDNSNPIFSECGLNFLEYMKMFNEDLMINQQKDKQILLDLLKTYPSSQYGLTRSLSLFLCTKSCFLHGSQFGLFTNYLHFLHSNTETKYKPTKQQMRSLIESAVSIAHPLMHLKQWQVYYIDGDAWNNINLLKRPNEEEFNKLTSQNNAINALLESFVEFLEKNQSQLQRVIREYDPPIFLKNNPSELILFHASQIKQEQDFDDLTIFTCFQKYLVLTFQGIQFHPRLAKQLSIFSGEYANKIQMIIFSLYDLKSQTEIFSRNTIRLLESAETGEIFERALRKFKKCRTNSYYQIEDTTEGRSNRYINARLMPFWYFSEISEAHYSIYLRPEQSNTLIKAFISQNKFRRDLQLSLESFFKHHAFYGFFYKLIFKCITKETYQCQHLLSVPLPSSTEYDPRYQESGLNYLENLDDILEELNYFTQFLIDLMEKENINQTFKFENHLRGVPVDKINTQREAFIRFVSRFLKKSETHTNRLLALAYSKSSKYQRSPQTLDLINTFICNRFILHSLRVKSGRKPSINLTKINQFLESIKESIVQFKEAKLEMTPICVDIPILFDQFGKLLAKINQKVIKQYGLQYSMAEIVQSIIDIEVQMRLIQETSPKTQGINENAIQLPEKVDESENISSFEKTARLLVAKAISKFVLDCIQSFESHLNKKGHFITNDIQQVIELDIFQCKQSHFGLNTFLESWFGIQFELSTINSNNFEEIIQSMKSLLIKVLNKAELKEEVNKIYQNQITQEEQEFECMIIHRSFESLFEFQQRSLIHFQAFFETFLPVRQLKLSVLEAIGLFLQVKWTPEQIQKQYDHCLQIIEAQCKILNQFSSMKSQAFKKKSVYVAEFIEVLKYSISLLKGLNNIVDDTRVDRMEALIKQLLIVKFINIKENQSVSADLLYLMKRDVYLAKKF